MLSKFRISKKILFLASTFLFLVVVYFLTIQQEPLNQDVGPEFSNFVLLDHLGRSHELHRYADQKAIVLFVYGNDCPVVQKSLATLKKIQKKYSEKEVVFLFITSNAQDTRESVKAQASEFNIEFPILIDSSQMVGRSLNLTRTAEVIVINPKSWKPVYRGALDDQITYGFQKPESLNNFLDNALQSFLKGKKIETPTTRELGCAITYLDQEPASFEKVVAPLIENKCLNCHSTNGPYKPTLDSHAKVMAWKEMIKETILTRRMPPWDADHHYGDFKNDSSLTPNEQRTLLVWLDSNGPKDTQKENLSAKIDSVVTLKKLENLKLAYKVEMDKEYTSPAEGQKEYDHFQLGGPTPEDLWVKAIRSKTNNPRSMHHQALMISAHPLSYYQKLVEEKRKLGEFYFKNKSNKGTSPTYMLHSIQEVAQSGKNENEKYFFRTQIFAGSRNHINSTPPGVAIWVPKGSYIILESHFVATGKEEKEKTEIEFFVSKTENKFTRLISKKLIPTYKEPIPPNTKNFELITNPTVLRKDIHLVSVQPHMHLRGRHTDMQVEYPDGRIEILASLPDYKPHWEVGTELEYKVPKVIPVGSKLSARCIYDNSKTNPYNPNPDKVVKWGQSLEHTEMCSMAYKYFIK